MKKILNSMLYQSFEFNAISYEIYENGCCIQRANCNTQIVVEHSLFIGMMFRLMNNPTYIVDDFTIKTASDDLLDDRVQYGRLRPIDYFSGDSSMPIICNLFPQNGILRFATPNPLRIIEFSGNYRLI